MSFGTHVKPRASNSPEVEIVLQFRESEQTPQTRTLIAGIPLTSSLVYASRGGRSIRTDDALDRNAAADLWRNTLSQIPSIFGRLNYVSSLRNPNNGKYEHHGLALVFGEEEANKALKKSHSQLFQEWLTFNLEQQKADLDLYIVGLYENRRTVIETWLKLSPYRNLIPASVRGVERRLYVSDLTALLELLKNEHGAAGPDRDA